MRENLFICLTPYHIFFVLNFVEIKKIKNIDILVLNDSNCNEDKMLHYLSVFKEKKDINLNITCLNLNKKNKFFIILNLFKTLVFFLFKKNKKYINVYIANIINLYTHYILSLLHLENIYTFDDGVANLNKKGAYFASSKSNFFRRLVTNYDHIVIRKKTKCHYTVYKNVENISDRVEFLGELNKFNIHSKTVDTEIYFIGQPVEKMKTNIDYKKIEEIMERFNVNFYFSHPFEKDLPFKNSIDTKLIGEDFFLDRIKSGVRLKLYGFYSSILFNMSGVENIEVYALYDEKLYENNKYVYDLMLNLDIKLLSI